MNTNDMTHNEWLAARRKGLGGSDAGAILGLNKWSSPLDVYLDKIGQSEPIEDNDAMYWGRTLEDIVADEYSKRTGNKVRRINRILQHKDHPFILANLDRDLISKKGILECKTAFRPEGWGADGTDEVPESYLAQVMHYMAVTNSEYADVAALIGGRDFRIYTIKRDDDLINEIIKREVSFWNDHVLAKVAPDPINANDVNTLWPSDSGETVYADSDQEQRINTLRSIKQKIKDLGSNAKELEVEIKKEMADASVVAGADGKALATWKERRSMRLDTKRLKVEQSAIYDQYAVQSSNRTFLIK
jgi:putative phage-type endonuclease